MKVRFRLVFNSRGGLRVGSQCFLLGRERRKWRGEIQVRARSLFGPCRDHEQWRTFLNQELTAKTLRIPSATSPRSSVWRMRLIRMNGLASHISVCITCPNPSFCLSVIRVLSLIVCALLSCRPTLCIGKSPKN